MLVNLKAFSPLLAVAVLFQTCGSPEYLSEPELVKYCQSKDNGLVSEKEIGEVKIKVVYRPTDLVVAQELRNQNNVSEEAVLSARKKYNGHYYFVLSLSLSKDNKELLSPANQGLAGFSSLLQTVSFGMSNEANLTCGRDTIPVADYVYNRTFSLGNSTDLLFVFDKAKAMGKEHIQFNLEEFGLGVGKQSFQFKTSDLEKAPKIFQP
jgi:hypothetical protein